MRAKIIRELEDSWNNSWKITLEKLVAAHPYRHLDQITDCLYNLVFARLNSPSQIPGFEELFGKNKIIRNYLAEGDQHYVELIRNSDLLNEHNRDFERSAPLTEIISDLCLEINGQRLVFKEGLAIYGVLSDYILEKLSQMLAADPEFQTYGAWQRIDQIFGDVQDLYAPWLEHICVNEKQTADIVASYQEQNLTLNELAILEGFSRRNADKVQHYLNLLGSIKNETPVEYIRIASSNNELVQLKSKYQLIERLLRKAGLEKWFAFLDAVYYPNVQDNMMLSITETSDFLELIRHIRNLDQSKSKKEHMLLIVLNCFYEFLDRTLLTLKDFKEEKIYPKGDKNKLQVASAAEQAYADWTANVIPSAVEDVMETLITRNAVGNDFFNLLFDWVASFDRTHVPLYLKSRIWIQGFLHDTLSKQITKHNPDLIALVASFSDQQINWNTLSLLRRQLLLDTDDRKLRKIIYEGYLRLMRKSNFHYTAHGDAGLEVVLNNAYYFSTVLAGFTEPEKEWQEIYNTHQLLYQGWLRNRFDGRFRDTETYMLTVAVGLAYYFYGEKITTKGEQTAVRATDMLIAKCRQECEDHSTIYELPLKFLALTLSKFDSKLFGITLENLIIQLDHLELVFHFCSVVPKAILTALEPAITSQLMDRIDAEFWIIENTYKRSLRSEFDYFKVIKQKIETL